MLKGIKKIPKVKDQIPIKRIHQLNQQLFQSYIKGDCNNLEKGIQQLQKLQQTYFQTKSNNEVQQKTNKRQRIVYEFEQAEQVERNKRNKIRVKSNKVQQICPFCPQNEQLTLISASNHVYLAFPKLKTFRKFWHLILAPIQHHQTTIGLEEEILQQLLNYKKCLLQMFDKINLHVVFWEQFSKPNSHIYIQCIVMKLSKAQDLPFFFKQALEDVEGNWATHRSIININKEKGGLQKQIPKKITYFYIDFSLGYGYAHVIEDEKSWKRTFCYEILATALGLEQHEVKTTQQYTSEELVERNKQFQLIWKPFDWTVLL